jgi:hypothetical protein
MVMHATHYSYQFACYIIKFDLIPESPHLADHQQHGPPSSVPDTMYKNHVGSGTSLTRRVRTVGWIGRFERLLRSDMATHLQAVSLMGPCCASSVSVPYSHLWHRTSQKLALYDSAHVPPKQEILLNVYCATKIQYSSTY